MDPESDLDPQHCLEDDALVDGELGNDVGEEEVAVVAGGGVHAVLGQQAGPRVGHQTTQLVALNFVGTVFMNLPYIEYDTLKKLNTGCTKYCKTTLIVSK